MNNLLVGMVERDRGGVRKREKKEKEKRKRETSDPGQRGYIIILNGESSIYALWPPPRRGSLNSGGGKCGVAERGCHRDGPNEKGRVEFPPKIFYDSGCSYYKSLRSRVPSSATRPA